MLKFSKPVSAVDCNKVNKERINSRRSRKLKCFPGGRYFNNAKQLTVLASVPVTLL